MWSKKYERCLWCGTTKKPHHAKGLCETCYDRTKLAKDYKKWYRDNNSEHIKRLKKEWTLKNHEHVKRKKKEYRLKNQEYISCWQHEWYLINKDQVKARAKAHREDKYFNSNREAALKRDGYKCIKCESMSDLQVHHKDGKGRKQASFDLPIDNTLGNLMTLCNSCHRILHNTLVSRWARKFTACVSCSTTSTRHEAHGLCVNCYQREERRKSKA